MRTIDRLSLVMLLILGLLVPAPAAVNATAASTPAQQAFPCYGGAQPPAHSLCLAVPVRDRNGAPARHVPVTITFGKKTHTADTGQTPDQPIGAAVAAIDVGMLGARPGDTVTIEVRGNGFTVRAVVSLNPDRASGTQYLDPIVLAGAQALGHRMFWGSVYLLGQPAPIGGAKVELLRDGKVIGRQVTPTGVTSPTFEIDPTTNLAINTPLALRATYNGRQSTQAFSWSGAPMQVLLVLGWNCGAAISRRSGGGGDLPDNFCLTVTALLDSVPVPGAQMIISAPGRQDIVAVTGSIDGLSMPAVAVDIGTLVAGLLPSDLLRVTAIKNGLVGRAAIRLADLGLHTAWGYELALALRGERTGASGLAGGTITPLAATNTTVYAGLPYGGGVVARHGGTWIRQLGNMPSALPAPETSALVVVQSNKDEDWLLAGTRGGELALSLTSGRSWTTLAPFGLGAVTALALAPDGSMYVADRQSVHHVGLEIGANGPVLTQLGSASPLAALIAALAVMPDGRLFAGAPDGLWQLGLDASSWTQVQNLPVTALAVAQPKDAAPTLLVGTSHGLLGCPTGGTCAAAGLDAPVLSLASDRASQTLYAITPDGLFESGVTKYTWRQTASSDTRLGGQPTVGLPDVYDLGAMPGSASAVVAAAYTGVYSSTNGGQNWAPVGSWPANTPVRSVAALADRTILALTASDLFRWDGHTWNRVTTVPAGVLNGSVVRASADGQQILVGRNAGPGASLYASVDAGQTWNQFALGSNRGVSAITFAEDLGDGIQAVVGTDGDGVFGWAPLNPAKVIALPNLLSVAQSARVSAVAVTGIGIDCRILVGTLGAPAQIIVRSCDSSSPWQLSAQTLSRADRASVGLVGAISATPEGKLFAATSDGIFEGALEGGWAAVFGVPLRPLTLLVPGNYSSERLLLTGGPQAGVLLLSDTAPDVAVRLVAPHAVRAGDILTYTVEARNLGLLPADSASLTLTLPTEVIPDPPNQRLGWMLSTLRTGEIWTASVTARASVSHVRVQAKLDAGIVAGEQFAGNNHAMAATRLDFPIAPDPAIILGGTTMARPGELATIHLVFADLGDQPGGGTVQLKLPVDLPLGTVTPAPTSSAPGLLTWQIEPARRQGPQSFDVQYRLPADLPSNASLTVTATLLPSGIDREPANNSASVRLRVRPLQPKAIVLVNWARLGLLGPTDELRRELDSYSQSTEAVEVALDQGACDPQKARDLPCLYANYDQAIAAVAKDSTGSTTRLDTALETRRALVDAIKVRVSAIVPSASALPLYIIGNDAIVPAGAVRETLNSDQSQLPESSHVAAINPADSIYSVLMSDAYLTDRAYAAIDGQTFLVGRQPGTPAQIANVLRLYNQLGGTLLVKNSAVAGTAQNLTRAVQRNVCRQIRDAGLPVGNCDEPPISPESSLIALSAGSAISSLSDHSDERSIGELSSRQLQLAGPSAANLLLLLGCHTALAPAQDLDRDMTLSEVLAEQGQPAFGYTGYAYAGDSSSATDTIAYAGQLHVDLVKRLLQGNLTLGEVLTKAIADYGGPANPIGQKTLDTLALYGPPTYRIKFQGGLPGGALPSARNISPAVTAANMLLTPSYTVVSGTFGIRYQAQLPNAATVELIAQGHTVQPGADLVLGPAAHGLFLVDGTYRDINNVDPVIPRIAPLGALGIATEPPYTGPRYDWATPAQVFLDGDGIPHARIPLGQWSPNKATERLFDAIHFQVLESGNLAERTPPRIRSVSACRVNQGKVEIRLRAIDVARAEAVFFDAGKVRTVSLILQGRTWTGGVPYSATARFLIQIADENGNVTFATHNDRLYTLPNNNPCNS